MMKFQKMLKRSGIFKKFFLQFLISSGLSVTSFRHFQRVKVLKHRVKGSLKVMKNSHDILIYWKRMSYVLVQQAREP